MGGQDYDRLHELEVYVNNTSNGNFHIDEGRFDTAILIDEKGNWTKCDGMTKDDVQAMKLLGWRMFVPDLIDYENKMIIEYNEEPKRGRGAHYGKKGHDGELDVKDADKMEYYLLANFNVLVIWESCKDWQESVDDWVDYCEKRRGDANLGK